MKTMTMNGKNYSSIDAYIRTFPKNIQTLLKKIRQAIKSEVPQAGETIKYQMPTFTLNGKNLAHFAAWKSHIGFYPTPGPISAFKKDLAKYEVSKGAIQIPLDKPVPVALIKKIIRYRIKQMNTKR